MRRIGGRSSSFVVYGTIASDGAVVAHVVCGPGRPVGAAAVSYGCRAVVRVVGVRRPLSRGVAVLPCAFAYTAKGAAPDGNRSPCTVS